jgi:trans-aconitate methyltransferase
MAIDSRTKQYYDRHAEQWAARKTNSFHHQAQFEAFVSQLPKRGGVLDIGCAAGIHVPLFLGIGRKLKYTGIDLSESFLKLARSRYPQLSFSQADILDPKTLPNKRFHGFWAAAVLMHAPEERWPEVMGHIEQMMRPGAIGYLTLPVEHPSGDRADEDPRHFTILDAKAHRKHFKARGWEVLKHGTLDGFTTKRAWRWYIVRLP